MILNVGILVLELLVLGALTLSLHAASRRYGLAPLLILVSGLVTVLHSVGSIPVAVEVGSFQLLVSSVVLVPVIFLALLVLYEVDGTSVARVTIVGVLGLSVLVFLVQITRVAHLTLPGGMNRLDLPADSPVFTQSWPFTLASMAAFVVSLTSVAVFSQALTNRISRIPRWATPGLALLLALTVDEVAFRLGAFGWRGLLETFPGGLPGKAMGTLVLWPMVSVYLLRVTPRMTGYAGPTRRAALDVVFGTYRQQEIHLRATEEERRRAEAALHASEIRFRNTFEQAPVGLIHAEPGGRITHANQSVHDLLGYPIGQMRGESLEALVHADDRDGITQVLRELRGGSRDVHNADTRFTKQDGRTVWVNATVTLARDSRENPHFFILVVEDLTHRRATEEQLRQAQKMEAVGQLTGGVAHDFNNLLTVVIGNLELALDDADGRSDLKNSLQQSLQAAQRGASLTQRLLAFSRKQALHPESLDPGELALGMRELLVRTLGELVEVQIESGERERRCVADRSQMESALLNLAINARDAMPSGGVLKISCDEVDLDEPSASKEGVPPGTYARVAVQDTGAGIDPAALSKVFEPFFTTKATGKGSGLGLSMVYGFTRQSGGFSTVESERDVGTTVCIYLPTSAGTIAA